MTSTNMVRLIGNVGKDVEVKSGANNNTWARVSLATERSYKDGNDWKTITSWHSLVFSGKLADRAGQRIKKGTFLEIDGSIEYSEKDGKHYTNIRVESFQVLERPPKTGNASDEQSEAA